MPFVIFLAPTSNLFKSADNQMPESVLIMIMYFMRMNGMEFRSIAA